MSKQTKKPAELTAKKVKNVNLLPQVFATEPNKKMLDSSLDLMTSKGQLSNFKETLGLRSATNSITEFFTVDSDEVRRESQANNMLVLRDSDDSYLGKTSYLDIENYFKVKGLELKDGIQLDKDINILDLPFSTLRLADYHLFYWVANDLPAMRLHFDPLEVLSPGSLTIGQRYKIYTLGITDFTTMGASVVPDGSFIPGTEYIIRDLGYDSTLTDPEDIIKNIAEVQAAWNIIAGTSNENYITGTSFIAKTSGTNGTSRTVYTAWFTATSAGIPGNPATEGSVALPKFSAIDDLFNKPTAIIVDDITGKSLTLQSGMVVYFSGVIEDFITTDINYPQTYFVIGVGDSVSLIKTSSIDNRIPNSYLKKRPWDKSDPLVDAPAIKWDSEVWDGSQIVTSEPEYITTDKYLLNGNQWGATDHWYHINLIKIVAEFLDISVSDIVSESNKAKRPIITFNRYLKLYNWPNRIVRDISSILAGSVSDHTGKINISDNYGHTLVHGDNVVFEKSPSIFTVSIASNGVTTFTPSTSVAVNDGALIVANSSIRYYTLIYKSSGWQFAQNKTRKNQGVKFDFFISDGTDLATFNEIDYAGATILDFAEGPVYDYILDRNIQVSSIDFDLINENNSLNISPNQIKFVTDVDATFSYNEMSTGEEIKIQGPFGYKYTFSSNTVSFYQPRRGLDITKQTQDLFFDDNTETQWSSEIIPTASGFDTIHVFYDNEERLKFYFNVEGHGLIRFSSKRPWSVSETLIPLISGKIFKIICHDLPYELTFHRTDIINNISRQVRLEEPYCTNNGIKNGVIELDLSPSILVDGVYIDNALNIDTTRLFWTADNTTRSAIIRPINKWRFLQFAYLRDKTNPVYESYDYTVSDVTLEDGSLSYYQQLISTPILDQKSKYGDKICLDSVLANPVSKTAPLSLTTNPLNAELETINFYSLYQHATNLKSNASNAKEALQTDPSLIVSNLGGGTLLKHNTPMAKAAIVATNLPYDFSEIIIKQGKHYDSFLNKLVYELEQVINKNNTVNMSSLNVLNLAVSNIFLNQTDNENFWYHSNMLGWGKNVYYTEIVNTINSTLEIPLSAGLSAISHRAGKETILHVMVDNKLLTRGTDYTLLSTSGYYIGIKFNASLIDKEVTIRQWTEDFNSKIPASLAKIGLSPVYKPEIYADSSYNGIKYFLYRHDGTRLYLEDGVDSNNYPVNTIEQLLYEYEKAVWSSIAYDIETNDNSSLIEDQPGYFRSGRYTWSKIRNVVNSEVLAWMAENNIFIMPNDAYDVNDPFTHVYQIGTGDDDTTMTGSWRAVYKYLYDTDRPHTHPWEMLGHTLKPTWWDTHYLWTDPVKRLALEKSLRTGNIGTPQSPRINPFFARIGNVNEPESFPVDTNGGLLAPNELTWLDAVPMGQERDWVVREQGPYELAFLNTQRGLAAETKLKFLASPARYVNLNWVPGQTITNEWGIKLDKTSNYWITSAIEHDYHRKTVNGTISYTAGIESLFAEFCALNNKDFKSTVIDKFNNLIVNKEFLLSGFSNKNNIRIESTSIASQRKTLFVPEENYQVRLVKHYSDREIFYSAMRVIWNGSAYSIHGFANEQGFFNYFAPEPASATTAKTIGNVVVKEKNVYSNELSSLTYGQEFTSRQEVYDIIVGYGKYLESLGFKFEEVESYDLRNWQLSAGQFIYWSNNSIASGNYIDLNPASSGIVLSMPNGQLENLEGTNENVGQCVDRKNKPLFTKDLLVERGSDITIKTKDTANPIYGIKLTFATYESVVHLDSVSVFDDIYFLPDQCTTKRSFVIGGKKSQAWDGKYFVPGYVVSNDSIIPNYDTFSEVGRNLLDIENVVEDNTVLEASRAQFGLTRNPELRQLFLQEETETLFKNAITYTKGTKQVFAGLEPLTHTDGSLTAPLEEYMVRIGEFGNTKNIEFYEFELLLEDVTRNPQVISFVSNDDSKSSPYIHYISNNSKKWVHRPYNKNLSFSTLNRTYTDLKTSGPIIQGDTDFTVNSLEDLPSLFSNFSQLTEIPVYQETASYKKDQLVRYNGVLYISLTTISPNTWVNNGDKFTNVDEPILPNIFVGNYNKPNPDLLNTGNSMFTPGTWQVLQTFDRNIGIVETCAGLTDVSKARITCNIAHKVEMGDYVLIVNSSSANSSVDGIWQVDSVENANMFYINTRITEVIKTGKVFVFKPVRFKNIEELNAATGTNADSYGYAWKKKNSTVGAADVPTTPGGFNATYPIAIIDDAAGKVPGDVSYDFGNYRVYEINQTNNTTKTLVKEDSLPLDHSDIEHLIVYDYNANKVLAKLELFDPRKMYLPAAFKNDIDVINRVDPAKYTRTTDEYKSAYASLGWYEEYVGRRWWDISTTQFNDYESGDALTRARFWGTSINGSLPDIYEWTKSPVHPTQWSKLVESQGSAFGQQASGEVYIDKKSGSDNYHWVEEQDYVDGNTYTVYYFWVKNKDTISPESRAVRIYSTGQLSKILLNPSAAGLSWWSPINYNSIVLRGVEHLLNNSSTVVQIKKKLKGEEKHQQWLFVSEANTSETIPQWIHTRLRDSIAGGIHYEVAYEGTDYTLTRNVPDVAKLHRYSQVGNSIRPYPQSWFRDIYEARRTFIKKVNQLLLNVDISSLPNWGDILNQTAYTLFDNVYDMTSYWTFTDYQSEDFNASKEISLTISKLSEIYTSFVTANSYIKVLEDNTIYEKDADGGFKVVYRIADATNQRGAIALSDDLFDSKGTWDGSKWDPINIPWDFDLCNVFYAIMEALRNNLFVNEYKNNYSKMTCAMFRYVLSEQVNVDWLQKSSTIEPINLISRGLDKTNTLRRDDIDVFSNFYSSVKSYRDKIRSATVNKQLIENTSVAITESLQVDDTEIYIGVGGETAGNGIIFI